MKYYQTYVSIFILSFVFVEGLNPELMDVPPTK